MKSVIYLINSIVYCSDYVYVFLYIIFSLFLLHQVANTYILYKYYKSFAIIFRIALSSMFKIVLRQTMYGILDAGRKIWYAFVSKYKSDNFLSPKIHLVCKIYCLYGIQSSVST